MFYAHELWPYGLIWLFLATAIMSAFIQPQPTELQPKTSKILLALSWPFLLTVTGILAVVLGKISLSALLFSLTGIGLAACSHQVFRRPVPAGIRIAIHIAVILWGLSLALHLVPGFMNLRVVEKAITGPASVPFNMHLNLNKPLLFFALLLLVPGMLGQRIVPSTSQRWILVCLFAALPALAWGLGLVAPEFSLPEWLWLFVLNNLFLTCVAEEALFRGYIQRLLIQRFSAPVGIVVASLLFGFAHFSGGPLFILLATLAGVLYGLCYYWSGRLLWAVLIHFAFNLVHLVFFTYPLAIKSVA